MQPLTAVIFLTALHPGVSLDSKSEFVSFTVMQLQLTELNSWLILLIFTEAFASVAPGSLVFCSLQETAMNCAQGDSVEVMCSRASDVNALVGGTVWIHTLKNITPVIS